MDYKFRQNGIILSAAIVLMVVSVVVIANWRTISNSLGRKTNAASTELSVAVSDEDAEKSEAETITTVAKADYNGQQLGDNLYAWKNDDSFFDSELIMDEVEHRIVMEIIPAKTKRNDETLREEQ